MDYKESGVDIKAGYEVVDRVKKLAASTKIKGVLGGIGHFGAFFEIANNEYKEPVLVSGTDGVGTKLKIAFMADKHDTIGIDAVAMSVNDVVCCGAKPLFFLDYLALNKVVPDAVEQILSGVAEGCRQSDCALIGGETAEMSDLYGKNEYDIAGFCVGIVEKSKIVDGSKVSKGDKLIALPSSGLHSNGFSLARKVVFEMAGYNVESRAEGFEKSIGDELLVPTRIYVKTALEIFKSFDVSAVAHITGGGLPENVGRLLKDGLCARIDASSWPVPRIFNLIEEKGEISREEMYNVFNMGVGMVFAVREKDEKAALEKLRSLGEKPFVIGSIEQGEKKVIIK